MIAPYVNGPRLYSVGPKSYGKLYGMKKSRPLGRLKLGGKVSEPNALADGSHSTNGAGYQLSNKGRCVRHRI